MLQWWRVWRFSWRWFHQFTSYFDIRQRWFAKDALVMEGMTVPSKMISTIGRFKVHRRCFAKHKDHAFNAWSEERKAFGGSWSRRVISSVGRWSLYALPNIMVMHSTRDWKEGRWIMVSMRDLIMRSTHDRKEGRSLVDHDLDAWSDHAFNTWSEGGKAFGGSWSYVWSYNAFNT